MKKLLVSLGIIAVSSSVMAQSNHSDKAKSGQVIYEKTINFSVQIEGDAAQLPPGMPTEQKAQKVLAFTENQALYENYKTEDFQSAYGSEGVVVKISGADSKIYTDLQNKKQTEQREFMTRLFLIERETGKSKWKMTGKQKNILGYTCQGAMLEDPKHEITAWFASEIPLPLGPETYGGLPGLILALDVDNGQQTIVATQVSMQPVDGSELGIPKKGKKVSDEEFKAIVHEKMNEMGVESGGHKILIKTM